jgi:hypothetical protein
MDEEQKNSLLEEFDLKDLPEDIQSGLIQVMMESMLKKITLTVLEKLSEEEREEFQKIKELENPEKTESFLKEKIPDYDILVEGVVSDFKEEMKEHVEAVKNEMK